MCCAQAPKARVLGVNHVSNPESICLTRISLCLIYSGERDVTVDVGDVHACVRGVYQGRQGPWIATCKSKWHNVCIRDVFFYRIPAPIGAGGPSQNTSRIQHKAYSPFDAHLFLCSGHARHVQLQLSQRCPHLRHAIFWGAQCLLELPNTLFGFFFLEVGFQFPGVPFHPHTVTCCECSSNRCRHAQSWGAGNKGLLNEILREQWNFDGCVWCLPTTHLPTTHPPMTHPPTPMTHPPMTHPPALFLK